MWRISALAAVALIAVAVAWPRPAAEGQEPLPRPVEVASGPKVVGAGSCAAASCHHGNGERGAKGSEYSTWAAVDPHAKAFRALYKPESKAMYDALKKGDPKSVGPKGAFDTPLCLQCHGMGEAAPAALHSDGTGCEQCHGPAERWKNTHYQSGFNRATEGFIDLRDEAVRPQTCMKCHVGDATREVNHDLIAAGHPRLRFEYGAYYANYPRHWAETKRRDDEARSWVVGQLVSAKAALELLADRAGNEKRPWPEFSEYECAACHHGLTKPSYRQERDARRGGGAGFRAGELPWGTWYYTLLPVVGEAAGGGRGIDLKALDGLMRKRVPDRGKVSASARAAAKQIEGWLTKAKAGSYTAGQVAELMRVLAKQSGPVAQGWDGGTQVYLGLAALHHAWSDLGGPGGRPSPMKAPLEQMRRSLRGAFPKEARPLYDSPLEYDPKKALGSLEAIRAAVR